MAAWMVTIAIIIDNYWSPGASLKTVGNRLNSYVQKQENSFRKWASDTAAIRSLMNGSYSESLLEKTESLPYFLFLYSRDTSGQMKLCFWSTQQVTPATALEFTDPGSGFALMQNGYYVWHTAPVAGGKLLALIPVKWNYPVTNQYLKNRFAESGISPSYAVTSKPGSGETVKSVLGNTLFHVYKAGPETGSRNNPFSAALLIGASLLLLYLLHMAASTLAASSGFLKGAVLFIILAGGLRSLSYFLPLPLNFRQYELFDPAIYGSNVIFASLGDLLINVLLFVWFILFLRFQLRERKVVISPRGNLSRGIIVIAGSVIMLVATFSCTALVTSLIADSKISFDVLNFFSLNVYSVIGFVILSAMAIGYYFLCQNILFLVRPLLTGRFAVFYLMTSAAGLIMLLIRTFLPESLDELYFYALGWLLLFVFLLDNRFFSLMASGIISSRLIFWIFFFCLSISAIIIRENTAKEMNLRRHYAELFATKSDPSNETMLNTMLTDFRPATLWPHFGRFYDSLDNHALKDSLLNLNAASYKDKYETTVLTFSPEGQPLYNSDEATFNELNSLLLTQARKTGKEGLYYFDESFEKFSYISKIDVNGPDSLLGFVFVIASPKQFKSETLYPELFSRGRTASLEYSQLYSIGLFKDGKLFGSYNDYPFPTRLAASPKTPDDFRVENDAGKRYSILWYQAGRGRMVAIARENRPFLESITLFSYLFCSFLLLAALFWIINGFARSGLNRERIRLMWQFNIRNQIHGTVILISVISFLFIGLATFFFFRSRYERSNRVNLARTAHIMERELKTYLTDNGRSKDSIFRAGAPMSAAIDRISEVHGMDVNLFGTDGRLLHTSFPLPYTTGIIGPLMNPSAYFHLNYLNEVQYFRKEAISGLTYSGFYLPIMDEKGHAYAFLNIPYFTAQYNLNQEISYFLITIINLNAFIFLIAGILALFITNRITGSFSMIAEKMKKVSLGGSNEPIYWRRQDEIGALVKEYNRMVSKLDESAMALAKSEREGAWREMARQVAHEIKNPLTPMKLSLQYLQRSIDNKEANVQKLTAEVAHTLIEQIDHLNNIANEFNQFAHIEQAGREIFDLHEILNQVLSLFRTDTRIKLHTRQLQGPLMISADKTHIHRVFTNLIKNAIQAVPESRIAEISIIETGLEGKVVISVSDNGDGIDEDVVPKIFTPNFTTKTSGSGLGLAICKRIAEQYGGNIRFETRKSEGTTFYVELPLVS